MKINITNNRINQIRTIETSPMFRSEARIITRAELLDIFGPPGQPPAGGRTVSVAYPQWLTNDARLRIGRGAYVVPTTDGEVNLPDPDHTSEPERAVDEVFA